MSQGPTHPPPVPDERDRRLIEAARAQAALVPERFEGRSPIDHGDELPRPGTFPGYEVLREIHRGGQGAVYLALQLTTKRKVAIKVMHAGSLAGSSGKARFEREVQILGQLHHPNIVKIFDSGVAADGRFYYVMDYISGHSLDEEIPTLARNGPREATESSKPSRSVRDTLASFVKICEAVNLAHLRGVIHRDLKPANIRIDASGEPVVVDFGLAKLTIAESDHSGNGRLMSLTGQFIGSMPWASPEQAEGKPDAIDVRTDVYSLGVILYQLLTGRFPYQVVGAMRDVLDNIMRAEPARPSTVRRQINDEVETIVLKCLSKEKERRYQSAGELARDIHRYLRGEPIEAKRDSGWYIITKTLRRYKAVAATLACIALLIIGFSIAMSLLYARTREAEREARAQAAEASRESTNAKVEAAKAVRVQTFLTDMLKSVDPSRATGQDPTVREVLDQAASRADADLIDQPLVLATVQDLLGEMYHELGQSELSEPLIRAGLALRQRFLEPSHPDVVRSLVHLAWLQRNQRKYDDAEALLKKSLEIAGTSSAFPQDITAQAKLVLARIYDQNPATHTQAEQLFRETMDIADGLQDRDGRKCAGFARWHLASLLIAQEKLDEAKPLLDQAAAIHQSNGDQLNRAKAILRISAIQRGQKQYPQAEATCRAAIDVMAQSLKQPDHPDLLAARSALAAIFYASGDFVSAEREFASIVQAAESAKQPPNKAQLPVYRASHGSCLIELSRFEEAERELLAAYDSFVNTNAFPAETTRTLGRLVKLYDRWGKPEQAARYKALMPAK